jgi:hypothetical protein
MITMAPPDFPMPVKRHLITGKWYLRRLPVALQYQTLLLMEAPLEQQVAFLPTHSQPPVFWTKLSDIKLHGSLDYPPAGHVCMAGDWDQRAVYPLPSVFEAVPVGVKKWDLHETVRSIFLFNRHYRDTPQYEAMILAVQQKSPNPPQACYTVQEVDAYFERLLLAFQSMKKHGYLTQQELGKSDVGEIRLHVTREGKLCLGTGGNHRIRMAEILGIRNIPFLLRGVHPEWVITLSRQSALPPHKALNQWLLSAFHTSKPIQE